MNESMMDKSVCKHPGVRPSKKSKVKRGPDEQEEVSDEESIVAGSLTVSPTLSCSAPSIDTDAEELSDLEQNEHVENGARSLKALGDVRKFQLVGRRLARVFADVDEANSEEVSDELSERGDD